MAPEPHFQEILSILRRRRSIVIAAAIIGMALALGVSLIIPPRYTAQAQIVFEPQTAYTSDGKPLFSQAEEDAAFQTQIAALTSRAYLARVVDSLARDPKFHMSRLEHGLRLRNWAARWVGARPPEGRLSAAEKGRRLDEFERALNVYQEHASYVITVAFTATSPSQAAVAANRVVQLYVQGKEQQERAQLRRAVNWLNQRIPQVRAGFEKAVIGPEAAAAGQVYEGMLQRREQLRTQQAVNPIDLSILSLATPPDKPSSFSPLLFIFPSLILFCTGGSLMAVAVERLDRSLHSARDVNDALGLPCIGLVPLIHREGNLRPHEYLLQNPFSAYTEAIRSVVTAAQLAALSGAASPETVPKVILISSSAPNEGKTTLAVSTAVYAALIGRRALLIDLDFRNPSVSREIAGQAGVGMDEAFDEQAAARAVQHVPGLNLDYLPAHGCPGELLRPFVDGHVSRLLQRLRDSYDCIIIDGPPLLGFAEARLLVALADTVLLAVKWGSTRGEVTQDAASLLREFARSGANGGAAISAVLTQVDFKKHTQYRYGGWESMRAIRGRTPHAPPQEGEAMKIGADDALMDAQPPQIGGLPSGGAGFKGSACPDAAEDRPLPLLLALLDEFRQQDLSYCYWRSSQRLHAALSGAADLDLLIAREDQHRAQTILLARGLKLFPDLAQRGHPAVSSYLGYDEASGRIVHLHLHFRLVVGEPLLKNYRLPWEAAILKRAVWHPILPIRVLDPASEALVLVARAAVEPSRMDPVALRQWAATTQKFERDRAALRTRLDRMTLLRRAGEVFTDELADRIVAAVFGERPLARHRRLRRRIRRELAAHRTYTAIEARLRSAARSVLWAAGNLNKRILQMPRPWSRRAPGGGRVVAVVGIDGSGKSTIVAAIRAWLGAEVDVMPIYFGTGDGRPSLLLLPLKMMVPAINRLRRTKPKGASHGRISDRPPGRMYGFLMMVWAAAVAAEKRTKLRATQRGASRGLVVVADRYPQNEDAGYNDGPLLPRLRRAPRWLRRFEARVYALARRLPPDLVLKLEVTPETAARREPDMDPAVIRQRIEAVHRLVFSGARVVRVDAERPLGDVLRSVKSAIWNAF
jgi:Mrp family chromosome partitioning ATPase/capsular polysaccharide biosynthesis protein/thymidylate kinase